MTLVLDHVALAVPGLDAAVARHVDLLGYRLLRRGTHVVTGGGIAMLAGAGGAKVELIEGSDPDLAHVAYRAAEPAALDAAHARLCAAGYVELSAPFRLEPARARTSFLSDPAGHRVQLVAYDPDSPDLVPDPLGASS
jgi:catechol 2,3-dioxygenase-like lactoylglutathione lyase family enzyme